MLRWQRINENTAICENGMAVRYYSDDSTAIYKDGNEVMRIEGNQLEAIITGTTWPVEQETSSPVVIDGAKVCDNCGHIHCDKTSTPEMPDNPKHKYGGWYLCEKCQRNHVNGTICPDNSKAVLPKGWEVVRYNDATIRLWEKGDIIRHIGVRDDDFYFFDALLKERGE